MVINGASLPESLLEALGMPSGGGFQIKLVRSGEEFADRCYAAWRRPACSSGPAGTLVTLGPVAVGSRAQCS